MVDFEKLSLIQGIERKIPDVFVYVVFGVHPESSDIWPEGVFFREADASKAVEWLTEHQPIDSGLGYWQMKKTSLRKWRGKNA